jgi:hypothetical protein
MNLIMFDISNLRSLGSARRFNLDLVGPVQLQSLILHH